MAQVPQPYQSDIVGKILEDRYELGEVIGAGSFGQILRATNLDTGCEVAIKEVSKRKASSSTVLREAEVMEEVQDHLNIVKLHEVIDYSDRMFMVMSLAGGGDLLEEVLAYRTQHYGLPEVEASRIFAECVLAVEHCHAKGIIHSDLKPENVLLTDDREVRLGDFGLSTKATAVEESTAEGSFQKFQIANNCTVMLTKTVHHAQQGTLNYASPESLSRESVIGTEPDVWSLGVLLYVLVRGRYPFWGETEQDVKDAILTKEDYALPSVLSSNVRNLLKGMLRKSRLERYTLEEVKKHRWLRNPMRRAIEKAKLWKEDPKLVDGYTSELRLKWLDFQDNLAAASAHEHANTDEQQRCQKGLS